MKDVILCSEQQESLDGIMLGDGHLELHGHEARLRIHHSGQQCDYVNKLYDIFSDYVLSPPACSEQHRGDKVFITYGFNTTTHPEFTRNWRAYYHATPETADSAKPTYVKRVPEDIDKRLTPKAFAHFISCDGSPLARSGIKLSTHSYSKSDNQRICDALATNFGINAVVRFEPKKGGRASSYSYIVIHRTYLEQVQKIVLPHLSPFFYYKVGLAPPR
jgi:LAGLIDADG DNA endonuclease family